MLLEPFYGMTCLKLVQLLQVPSVFWSDFAAE